MTFEEIIKLLKKENLVIMKYKKQDKFSYLSCNSLDVSKDTLFICKGYNFKEQYLYEAILKGVTCYISENLYNTNISYIIVKDIRKAMTIISKEYYKLNDNLFKIGITGTKGKTTTVYFIHNILNNYLQKKTAYISTIDYYSGKNYGKSHNTTPDSMELFRIIKEAEESNSKYLTMEISSQAVKLDRIYGINYDIGGFLNIGEDHIAPNEHPSFEDYLDCKIKFLERCQKVFIYREIEKYDYIKEKLKDKDIITFGFNSDSDFCINSIVKEDYDTLFKIKHGDIEEEYRLTISGSFNCINACLAVAIAKSLNISYEEIYKGLYETKVDGRMTVYENFICPVIVDYAHNKISIETLIKSLKSDYPNKNLKIVVGCPGDKAYNRRKEVGELTGEYASYVYLTAEDPGSKNVKDICDEIITYLKPYHNNYKIIEDRENAIISALNNATKDDVIAIIGKGDETYQLVKNEYLNYKSDLKVVEEQISKITN